jgi:hypothetical protein
MKYILPIFFVTLLTSGCNRGGEGFMNKQEKVITVEITGTNVILLEGKRDSHQFF